MGATEGKDRRVRVAASAKSRRRSAFILRWKGSSAITTRKRRSAPGVTGELLLQQLERRLDNVAFRLGFASSRRQARQIVRHGHVEVNGRKVNIPSYQVSVGDEIKIRQVREELTVVESSREFASHQAAPGWLAGWMARVCRGKVLALPKREDVNLPVNEQLIVELYSK